MSSDTVQHVYFMISGETRFRSDVLIAQVDMSLQMYMYLITENRNIPAKTQCTIRWDTHLKKLFLNFSVNTDIDHVMSV